MEALIECPIASDREVQCVALHREVEGVAGDFAGGLQPGGERELAGLARERIREQAMLDLRGKRERDRALQEVGEAAVGDHDVRERVRSKRDVGQRPLIRRLAQRELEHADRLPAIRDWREYAGSVGTVLHHERLFGERPAVWTAAQRHTLCGFPALRPGVLVGAGMAEPDQGAAAEVGDQQRHPGRAEVAARRSPRTSAAATAARSRRP
jgi:hypothetical protein